MSNLVGALSETKDATEETKIICDQVRASVEEKTKKKYEEFRAVKYMSQIVAGVNFFIKVDVGGDKYLHLKVFKRLTSTEANVVLLDVLEDVGKDDPIVYF